MIPRESQLNIFILVVAAVSVVPRLCSWLLPIGTSHPSLLEPPVLDFLSRILFQSTGHTMH